jgi:site-specific recombinase XerD
LLSDNLCQALDEYLEARKMVKRWSDKLFASCSGNTWHRREIRKAIQRHRQHIGLSPLGLGQPTHPKHWADDDRSRFLQTPVRPYDRSAEQAQLVLGLGLHCGLRREEMVTVRVGDVDLHRELYVLGKGNKKRRIPLNAYMVSLLKPIVVSRLPEEPLLVGEDGSGLSVKRIGLIVGRLAREAGVTYKKVTPHTLRHSFATNLKDAGVPIDVIQKLLGYGTMADTERYLHTDEEKMRDAVERIWQG